MRWLLSDTLKSDLKKEMDLSSRSEILAHGCPESDAELLQKLGTAIEILAVS